MALMRSSDSIKPRGMTSSRDGSRFSSTKLPSPRRPRHPTHSMRTSTLRTSDHVAIENHDQSSVTIGQSDRHRTAAGSDYDMIGALAPTLNEHLPATNNHQGIVNRALQVISKRHKKPRDEFFLQPHSSSDQVEPSEVLADGPISISTYEDQPSFSSVMNSAQCLPETQQRNPLAGPFDDARSISGASVFSIAEAESASQLTLSSSPSVMSFLAPPASLMASSLSAISRASIDNNSRSSRVRAARVNHLFSSVPYKSGSEGPQHQLNPTELAFESELRRVDQTRVLLPSGEWYYKLTSPRKRRLAHNSTSTDGGPGMLGLGASHPLSPVERKDSPPPDTVAPQSSSTYCSYSSNLPLIVRSMRSSRPSLALGLKGKARPADPMDSSVESASPKAPTTPTTKVYQVIARPEAALFATFPRAALPVHQRGPAAH